MAARSHGNDAAQNQHYVPKFILRNFLSDAKNERVSVFSKSTGRGFVTSIRNIMAERRFHDFSIDDKYIASFEEAFCRIEDRLLPTYRRVVEQRRLERSTEERNDLALLVAFQLARTRYQREQFLHMEQQLKDHLGKQGFTLDQVKDYEPLTTDRLTQQHLQYILSSIPDFAQEIAAKDLLLMSAPAGRSFYLADNPVSLHNSEPAPSMMGNVGLAMRGAEIYLPLSADLMLAAWCPTIVERVRTERDRQQKQAKSDLLGLLMRGQIKTEQMQQKLAILGNIHHPVKDLLAGFDAGLPVAVDESDMDFSNSLQVGYARDFIICKAGDFELARRFVKEFPNMSSRRSTGSERL